MYDFYVYQAITTDSPANILWAVGDENGDEVYCGASAAEAVAAIVHWLEDDGRAPGAILQDSYDIMFRTPSEDGIASGIMSYAGASLPIFYRQSSEEEQRAFWREFVAYYRKDKGATAS